jgi:hypothetical protein
VDPGQHRVREVPELLGIGGDDADVDASGDKGKRCERPG